MKKVVLKLLAFFLTSSVVYNIQGQNASPNKNIPEDLIKLETESPFAILVSNDSMPIPSKTIENLEKAKIYFDGLFQKDLEFKLLLIDNKKWNRFAYFPPPGLPQAGQGKVIIGLEKSVLSREVEKTITQLPPQALAPLRSVYGEPIDLDLFYRELLSIHELAHLYHFKEGIQPQRKWLQELFATMSMYAFIKNKSPEDFKLMDTYPMFVSQAGDRMAQHKSLIDFEEKYVQQLSPPNYEWFQIKLYQHAKSIIDSEDIAVLKKLYNFLIRTDLDKQQYLSDSELSILLKKEVNPKVANIQDLWEVHK